ncbi:MAG TPA: BPSL0067 family protein [Xanthobacteraceae bacterium]|nr:BPSL0067 family protein [Xanthobacteraceae bacterium]
MLADPARFDGRVVDNGHCVRFVQIHANMPHTSAWRRGPQVRGSEVARGTVIATFGGTPPRYQNRTDGSSHAAVFSSELPHGLSVWDQWRGQPVHNRVIRFRGGQGRAVNDGDAFFTVETA